MRTPRSCRARSPVRSVPARLPMMPGRRRRSPAAGPRSFPSSRCRSPSGTRLARSVATARTVATSTAGTVSILGEECGAVVGPRSVALRRDQRHHALDVDRDPLAVRFHRRQRPRFGASSARLRRVRVTGVAAACRSPSATSRRRCRRACGHARRRADREPARRVSMPAFTNAPAATIASSPNDGLVVTGRRSCRPSRCA